MQSGEQQDVHMKTGEHAIRQEKMKVIRPSIDLCTALEVMHETRVLLVFLRAFEDDDCVAVIEQSPNTSDTRARPPGPSLVTVQMEPTFEDLQEDTQANLGNHSVTVETYPEPILDTKV